MVVPQREEMKMYEEWEDEQYEQAMEDLADAQRDAHFWENLTPEELAELRKPAEDEDFFPDSEF